MTWLLQWYISRELGKTFALWAVGLTLVFALCGGVMNMIAAEGVTANQMAEILGFVLPVALTLTLPVSALISTALTYGRLSADNEFNACRSSGINIHVLFLPPVLLSLIVAAFTFCFSNFVIPEFIRSLEEIVRADLHKYVSAQLNQRGYIKAQNYVMYADVFSQDPEVIGIQRNDPQRKDIVILGGAFIELKGGEQWLKFGTAKSAVIQFDNSGDKPSVRADLIQVRGFDRVRSEYFEEDHQMLGPYPIDRAFAMKTKWLDLPRLLYYRRHPQEMGEIKSWVDNLRSGVREVLFYNLLRKAMEEPPNVFRFSTGTMQGELRAESMSVDSATRRLRLNKPKVVQTWADRTQRYAAESAAVRVRPELPPQPPRIIITLEGPVELLDSRHLKPNEPIRKAKETLDPFPMPAEIVQEAASFSAQRLLNEDHTNLSKEVEKIRIGINKEIVNLVLDMTGIIHARAAFSASVFVLVILGAALGILFRGADYLTAFFVSFLPGLFIVVSIIMGRQLVEKPNTADIGVAVIWGVIGLVAVADGVVMARFLRR